MARFYTRTRVRVKHCHADCRVVFKTGKECANKTGQGLEDRDVK
jgi:hypothetical protein